MSKLPTAEEMAATRARFEDPNNCQLCGNPLTDAPVSPIEKRVHEGCLGDMLRDEWMAERAAEEWELRRQWEEITS